MSGAQVILAVNIAIGALFVGGYAVLALSNRSQRAAIGFSVSYLLGMLSPVADFCTPLLGHAAVFEWLSFGFFLAALVSISITFAIYCKVKPPIVEALGIFIGGLGARALIWTWTRDTIGYGMAYQLPFILAALLATRTVLELGGKRKLHIALAAVFALFGAHFLVKPFLAAAFGSGATLGDYTRTLYALLSQAGSGILLLAAGLLLLLVVAQRAIVEMQLESETDPLSGLSNRRGFDRLAEAAIARAASSRLPLSVAMFDLDHFKRVNDAYGHGAGDGVIAAFARLMRRTAPDAIIGRQGGEEFVMLIEAATGEGAWLAAESIRTSTPRMSRGDMPSMTVSAGVAELSEGETLAELMRRADQAAYSAKNQGRDRVCLAQAPAVAGGRIVETSGKSWRTRHAPHSDL